MRVRSRSSRQTTSSRRGVAATELAVCLPVLVLLVLATVETTGMIFVQQSLEIACYEATRVALAPGAEEANVKYQAELILQSRGVKSATVTVSPADIPGTAAGAWISVKSSAPFSANSLMGGWLFKSKTLVAEVQMMKER